MSKKQYQQRLNKITVRSRDNPAEYARQYYWIVIKGKSTAPSKRAKKTKTVKKKNKWSF
jgi:hypothetical protein